MLYLKIKSDETLSQSLSLIKKINYEPFDFESANGLSTSHEIAFLVNHIYLPDLRLVVSCSMKL